MSSLMGLVVDYSQLLSVKLELADPQAGLHLLSSL